MNNHINDINGAVRLMCRPEPLGISTTNFVIKPDGTKYAQVFDGDFGLVSPPPSQSDLVEQIMEDGMVVVSLPLPVWLEEGPTNGSRLLSDDRIASVDWTNPSEEDLELLSNVAEEFRSAGCHQTNPPETKMFVIDKDDLRLPFENK